MSYPVFSDKLPYDNCAIQQQNNRYYKKSNYQFFLPKEENCNKCIHDKFYFKQDPTLVDLESELRNQTRPLSKCNRFQYNSKCNSSICKSTFDTSNPIIPNPLTCTIIRHNYPRFVSVHFPDPKKDFCKKK